MTCTLSLYTVFGIVFWCVLFSMSWIMWRSLTPQIITITAKSDSVIVEEYRCCHAALLIKTSRIFDAVRKKLIDREKSTVLPGFLIVIVVEPATLGNLRTTTKFATTTSVDWERTGTRTSVSAGKRKLKMQSIGRSTTTTLNVNTNVKLWCSVATNWCLLKQCKILLFKPYV